MLLLPARNMSQSTKSSKDSSRSGLNAKQVNALLDEWSSRKGRSLTWFRRDNGRLLRLKVKTHVPCRMERRSRWALCNVNNKLSQGGVETYIKCNACQVYLCTIVRQYKKCCWDEWHEEEELFQRISLRMAPQKNWSARLKRSGSTVLRL